MNSKKIFNILALVSVEIKDRYMACNIMFDAPITAQKNDGQKYFHVSHVKFMQGEEKKIVSTLIPVPLSAYCSEQDLKSGRIDGHAGYAKYIVENEKVFNRACVELTFMGGKIYTRDFDTYEKALEWGDEKAKEGIKVRLEINPII